MSGDLRAAIDSNQLSHDVRVLACSHCGGPNRVPVQGGFVECAYCRAGLEIALRNEESLARGDECEYDRIIRLRALRAQDGKPLHVPPNVARLLLRGILDPAQRGAAFAAWTTTQRALLNAFSRDPEEALYFLAYALADNLWVREKHVEARAILECAAEVLRTRRFRQSIYCTLAKRAAQVGDLKAAEDWLRPCDPNPYDLHMDSDYRLARAFIATLQGDFQTALHHLGRTSRAHPFAEAADALALMYRSHAIEHTEGVSEASELILEYCRTHDVQVLRDIHRGSPIQLCPASFPLAMRNLPLLRSGLGIGPIGCGLILLLAVIPMWLNVFWWREVWFESATATWAFPLVLSITFGPLVLVWLKSHRSIREKRLATERAWKGSLV